MIYLYCGDLAWHCAAWLGSFLGRKREASINNTVSIASSYLPTSNGTVLEGSSDWFQFQFMTVSFTLNNNSNQSKVMLSKFLHINSCSNITAIQVDIFIKIASSAVVCNQIFGILFLFPSCICSSVTGLDLCCTAYWSYVVAVRLPEWMYGKLFKTGEENGIKRNIPAW